MNFLECVPNLSEGRDIAVIDRLAEAASGNGAQLLDRTSDPDHHRTVFTLAGEPEPLIEALLRLYEAALREIDLAHHRGAHPRVGAVDVAPFVPLGSTPMEVAVEAAHHLGEALARRFEIPVFYYDRAFRADRDYDPARRNLAKIRRGSLEGLARRMDEEPAWRPDHGPVHPHPTAGATVVGARFFLVAFNAVLETGEIEIARRIARRVRQSSGGLPAVKALGIPLGASADHRAQVSMNLVDYRITSITTALAAVREEAARLGTTVRETEIIGLIPRAAVEGVTAEELLLPGPLPILEDRLAWISHQSPAAKP